VIIPKRVSVRRPAQLSLWHVSMVAEGDRA
jgi:hypothetical protein